MVLEKQERTSDDMLNRPVFWQTRALYVPPPPRTVKKPGKVIKLGPDLFDNVKLLGVYSVDKQSGLIVAGNQGSQRLKVGDELEGWVFESMNQEGAVFSQDGEQRVLALQKPTPPTKEEMMKSAEDAKTREQKRVSKAAMKIEQKEKVEAVKVSDKVAEVKASQSKMTTNSDKQEIKDDSFSAAYDRLRQASQKQKDKTQEKPEE